MEQENGASSSEDIQEKVEKVRKNQHLILKWSLNDQAQHFFILSKVLQFLGCILYTSMSTE